MKKKTVINEQTVVLEANRYLKQEMEKRWPMLYKVRIKGNYVAMLPNGFASHLQITCYASGFDQYVLRLTDCMPGIVGFCKVQHYEKFKPLKSWRKNGEDPIYSFGSFKGLSTTCEVTFTLKEMKKIIPWALDNYICVKKWNRSMPALSNKEKKVIIGKPLRYIRSKKTAEALDIIYKYRKPLKMQKPQISESMSSSSSAPVVGSR